MANFNVSPEMLRNAAKKLDSEIENYQQASTQAMTAGRALAGDWEGDAQKAFTAEQEKASGWYNEMVTIARQYSVALNNAANEYERADQQSSSEITKK